MAYIVFTAIGLILVTIALAELHGNNKKK